MRYALPDVAEGQLERLLDALAKEPDPHTTISEPAAAVEAHVADSLTGLEIEGVRAARRMADVGAGVGFPGLVLAIALPSASVDLIEATRRKAGVIDRLRQAADVDNARSVVARVEEWARTPPALGAGRELYDVVTARAVGPLAVLVEYAAPLLRPNGVLVAWKGARDPAEEGMGRRAAHEVGMALEGVLRVKPFAEARNRHLYSYRKVAPTPERFPRRPGMAAKRPLGGR